MSIINNNLLLAGTDEAYNLTRSLRFRSSASAYLNRTFAAAGNQKTMTFSLWVKRGLISDKGIYSSGWSGSGGTQGSGYIEFTSNNLSIGQQTNNAYDWRVNTSQVFRDPSAWYHIVISIDTTQSTAANRVIIYVNGSQVTAYSVASYPTQNSNTKLNASAQRISALDDGGNPYATFDGYLTEVNFIDGQALTPSSFGETDTITGVWKPKRYAGTYGTNGFYLPFTDNSALTTSSNAGLGKDFSGNGNYWTTNNISVTSGVTYDSMTDVPTLTSATAANFAVLNPLDKGANVSVTEGNLLATISSTGGVVLSSIGISSGKWYWEMTRNGGADCVIGIANSSVSRTAYLGSDANGWGYIGSNGNKVNNGSSASYGSSYATNIVIGVALDMDSGTVTFYRNNVSQGTAYSSLTGTIYAAFGTGNNTDSVYANFGQRPFAYTPPTGFVALNTYNLPTPTIVKGNTVMDVNTWTGNGSTQTITNAAGFKPDFVWIKNRNNVRWHILTDSVRGNNKQSFSNDTAAEESRTDRITSFNSNGFSVGSYTDVNYNADTFVGWQWQAGQGTNTTNTSGSITSTVSVNATAGFSVVTYTGTGSAGTIGHGLGVAPQLIIVKPRSATVTTDAWNVYHTSTGNTQFLVLNATDAATSASNRWNNTSPTSSVFSIGTVPSSNAVGYVAYCFAPIAGYSAFGSYTGNGSATGPFIYTGFQPRYLLVKRSDSTANWFIWDTARNPYNVAPAGVLFAESSAAEYATSNGYSFGITSNGFYLPVSTAGINGSGGTFIYAAFATNPFKNSLAF